MTWLEKFKREHPLMRKQNIIDDFCPEDRLIVCASEDDPEGRTSMCPVDDRGETLTCEDCWLRKADGGLTVEGPDRT